MTWELQFANDEAPLLMDCFQEVIWMIAAHLSWWKHDGHVLDLDGCLALKTPIPLEMSTMLITLVYQAFCLWQRLLESPNSLYPAGSKGQTGPGETPERPIPNTRKRTSESKNGDKIDMSTGKKPVSSGQEKAQQWPLATISDCWWKISD